MKATLIAASALGLLAAATPALAATYYRATTPGTTVTLAPDTTPTTILSVKVPKGNWNVTGTATLIPDGLGHPTIGECSVLANGVYAGANNGTIGNAGGTFLDQTIVSSVTVTLAASGSIDLVCRTNFNYSGATAGTGSLMVVTAGKLL